MASTPPSTACDRSQSGNHEETRDAVPCETPSPSIRGEETDSPSLHDTNESFASTDMDESSDDWEIQRAERAIRAYCPRPLPNNPRFSLSEQSYEKLRQNLEAGGLLQHFDEEVRSDWDPFTGKLTLKVAISHVQGFMTVNLWDAITKELDRVAEKCPDLRKDRKMLAYRGRAQIGGTKHPSFPHHSPDMQCRYWDTPGPQFVCDVAYSRTKEDMKARLLPYFRHNSVCTVLLIDIDYASPQERQARHHKHRATFSLWTTDKEDKDCLTINCSNNNVFRDYNGCALQGELVIPFKCFLPPSKRTNEPAQDEALVFPYRLLADLVKQAEDIQRERDRPAPPPPKIRTFRLFDENGNLESVERREPGIRTVRWFDENGNLEREETEETEERDETKEAEVPRRYRRVEPAR